MESSPNSLEALVKAFSSLPGIGRKSAQRIAYHILRQPNDEALVIADAIRTAKESIRFCEMCFNFAEDALCAVCSDTRRDDDRICVVEKPSDIAIIEKPGRFRGRYHVLGGLLSPLSGIGPEDIRVKELVGRISDEVHEVILALNPSVEGEATTLYISRLLKPSGTKLSRLAQGLPAGSELEFADELTLSRAIDGRIDID